jgi:hypothetical protein
VGVDCDGRRCGDAVEVAKADGWRLGASQKSVKVKELRSAIVNFTAPG